jgi:exopolysaccharide production protein ExoZ
LLRALAAIVVAVGHIGLAFADHVGDGLGRGRDDGGAAQSAVMLFFVISGYVIVVASRGVFGQPGARRAFWTRRANRIMPPYWIASGMLAVIFLTLFPQKIDPAGFLKSLALIPFWPDDGSLRPIPFLWVGWTLFFEMVFYFWFGLFIQWPRRLAMTAVMAMLTALVVAGHWVPPQNAFLFTIARPVSLMFMAGCLLALWRTVVGSAPAMLRLGAVVAMVPVIWLVPGPAEPALMGFDYLMWSGLPSLLLAFAALSGPLALPYTRRINQAGDISYALYLLHVPVAWAWLWFYPKLARRVPFLDNGPWDYLVTAVLAAGVSAWLFFTFIERPLTRALNRQFASPHSSQD